MEASNGVVRGVIESRKNSSASSPDPLRPGDNDLRERHRPIHETTTSPSRNNHITSAKRMRPGPAPPSSISTAPTISILPWVAAAPAAGEQPRSRQANTVLPRHPWAWGRALWLPSLILMDGKMDPRLTKTVVEAGAVRGYA